MNSTRKISPKLELPKGLKDLPRVSFTREQAFSREEEDLPHVAFEVNSLERAVSEFDKRIKLKR